MTHCLLCGHPDPGREPFVYEYEGVLYPAGRCRDCGFVFLVRQPGPGALARMYGEAYFESDYHCGHAAGSYFECGPVERAAADALLADYPLREATVEVRKFVLPCCDHVAVRVTRARAE